MLKSKPIYAILLTLLIASILAALWQLSVIEEGKTPLRITHYGQEASLGQAGFVIGSKTGKKYYFPWCGTVNVIKPENRVTFSSVEEAREAGYTPALNCKGLE